MPDLMMPVPGLTEGPAAVLPGSAKTPMNQAGGEQDSGFDAALVQAAEAGAEAPAQDGGSGAGPADDGGDLQEAAPHGNALPPTDEAAAAALPEDDATDGVVIVGDAAAALALTETDAPAGETGDRLPDGPQAADAVAGPVPAPVVPLAAAAGEAQQAAAAGGEQGTAAAAVQRLLHGPERGFTRVPAAAVTGGDGSAARPPVLPAAGDMPQPAASLVVGVAVATGTDPDSALSVLRRLTVGLQRAAPDSAVRGDGVAGHAGAAPASAAGGPSTPAAGGQGLLLDTPFQRQPEWQQSLGERVQWLIGQQLQGARIRLNPAHLGPMEVRIQVQNDQASIQFMSAHGVVRDALEAAVPRLRDMLDANGIDLVDVDVSGQSFAEQQHQAEGHRADARGAGYELAAGGDDVDPAATGPRLLETPLAAAGLLDLFA